MSVSVEDNKTSWLSELMYICRGHIILVAMAAQVVFGWLMSGQYLWTLTLCVAIDWFFINLLNRVTDLAEDERNNIPGTELVRRNVTTIAVSCVILLVGSMVWSHLQTPELTIWRTVVFALGVFYNFKLIPFPGGATRLKELYFFKNFGSAVIFFFTCFVYPHTLLASASVMSDATFWLLVGFFLTFEMTYEIAYDIRDVVGDTEEGVPTYPVVHGSEASVRINYALLAISSTILLAGFLTSHLGIRELLMIAAPMIHFVLFSRWKTTITKQNCIFITHLGTGLLLFYLAGNYLWLRAGLPANIFLG